MSWRVEDLRGAASEFVVRPLRWDVAVTVFEVTRPAVVLGSSQPEGAIDGDRAAAADIDVVRRRSGGGAVLVEPDHTLWLDVTIPVGDARWDADVGRAFHWLGRAWVAALGRLDISARWHDGPMQRTRWSDLVCFAGLGPGEVTIEGRKVVGMSQRRTRAGILYECCALLRWEPDRLLRVTTLTAEQHEEARSDIEPRAAGIGPALGPPLRAAFIAAVGGHCAGCGRPANACDGRCRRPLDPPRFCTECGRRLAVQVTPAGYTARCREHGLQ